MIAKVRKNSPPRVGAQGGLSFLSYQTSEVKLSKKSRASPKTSRLFFAKIIVSPFNIQVETKHRAKSPHRGFFPMPFPVLSEREGERQLFFIGSLQSGGGLFKKEGAAFFFGKFAPRREREAESQGQKRGGGSPKLAGGTPKLGETSFLLVLSFTFQD